MAVNATGRSRFSLLLLEEGEVLLSDLAVQYHFIVDTSVGSALHPFVSYPQRFVARSANSSIRGRIKIGTKSIFFDSEDWRDPVVRIPLASVDNAQPTRDNSRSRGSEESLTRASLVGDMDDENSVLVFANKAIFQRELGTDHPYVEVQLQGKHIFTPLYSSAFQLLDEINRLLQISATSSRRKRDEKLRNLVQERESRVPFDITLLEHGVTENAIMDSAASAVYALSRAPGRFRITAQNVYFMPIHGDSTQAVERIPTGTIRAIRRLRHGCYNSALEIGFSVPGGSNIHTASSTLMVSFQSFRIREKAVKILLQVVNDGVEMYDRRELETALNKWRRGQLSNFNYIMYLNMAAGRSFNDLSQYPVFPWILCDYDSETLELSRESSFRDLSKPIGALEPKRLAALQERFAEMPTPQFFYGTHYSTPAYTINYLLRAAPGAMLRLQNGRFDTPDRLFHSISDTWHGVLTNQGDVKELIPEFFAIDFSEGNASGIVGSKSSPGEFLDNVLGLDLGTRQDGKRVDDVELPPWANGSSELFVRRHREALESVIVSSKLHSWIDLIFGIKSRSADAYNVFYTDVALPSSLESAESSKLSVEEISQIETVYLEFGRTPERLFGHPHPPRFGDIEFTSTPERNTSQDVSPDEGTSRNGQVQHNEPPSDGNREDSKTLTNGDLNVAKAEEVPDMIPVSHTPPPCLPAAWGAQSRRRDSVLSGASEHVLMSFEPSVGEKGTQETEIVPTPFVSHVLKHNETAAGNSVIVDICMVSRQALEGELLSNDAKIPDSEIPVLCTVWSDGYLRVHSESRTLRSKHIPDARSVAFVPPGIIVYGTLIGAIGFYHIETGRTEEVQPAAHDAEVHALECLSGCNVIISGSKDASAKVWRFERQNYRQDTLRLLQELDAESSIVDVCGAVESLAKSSEDGQMKSRLLVGAATADGLLLAWEIDMVGEEHDFLEPTWRTENRDVGDSADGGISRRVRKVCWLYQGCTRRHALASIHTMENCMRVWSMDEAKMASAEVFLPERGALSVTACNGSRTVLVGGEDGYISEFDSTGLCLGRVTTGKSRVRNIMLPENSKCMYVFSGVDEVLRVNR